MNSTLKKVVQNDRKLLLPDGREASDEALLHEGVVWARHFAHDVRSGFCHNQTHDCTETCVKKQKKKLEALESLRASAVPSCRFWFFRLLLLQKLIVLLP